MTGSRPRIRQTIIIVCAIVAPIPVVYLVAPLPTAYAGTPLIDELAMLPGDVDFALGVRDMANVRATPLGQGVTALVQTGILIGGASESETIKAWQALSNRLGFTDEQSFDAILGDRFFYASRERDDGGVDWVMFSRTSSKVARHMRRKLDVAPREIKHERVLMSLEGGAFRLGSLIEGENAWLMLAPTLHAGLFDQISNMNGQPQWKNLGETQPLDEIRILGDGELALFMTLGDEDDEGWLGLVARARGDSVEFGMLSDPGTPVPAIEPWSTTMFDELRDGALYAQIERLPTGQEVRAAHQDDQIADSIMEGLRTLFEMPRRMLGQELELILGRRLAIVAHSKEEGGLSIGVGIEASDIRALASPGDAAMRSIADSIRTIYGAREESFEFIGTLPRALRRVTLVPDQPGEMLSPFGETLSITWSFRDTPGHAPAGWWVAGTDNEAFGRCAGALTGLSEAVDDGQSAAWLTLIEAHPAALISSLRSGGGRLPHAFDGLESVESLWLRTWIPVDHEGKLVLGAGSVRINEPHNPGRGPKRHQR